MPGDGGPLLILCGPTACGKTDTGIALAQRLRTEIISADSVQVYRGFDIGSSKPDAVQSQAAAHHLVDVADPAEEYNAARFRDEAAAIAKAMWAGGRLPLVVGGTGLYIKALTEGMNLSVRIGADAEERLAELFAQGGQALLYAEMARVDPQWAARIHPNDTFRTHRALGVYYTTGMTMSQMYQRNPNKPEWDTVTVVMSLPREELYRRITARAVKMMEAGWLDEVNRLKKMGYNMSVKPMRSIGYKEMYALSEGLMSRQEALDAIVKGTKALARRQMTWFRKTVGAALLPLSGNESAESSAESILRLDEVRKFLTLHGVKT